MKITITDPAVLEAMRTADGVVEFVGPTGHYVRSATLRAPGALPPGIKSPFTEEEMEEYRMVREGRSLKDILRDLEGRG